MKKAMKKATSTRSLTSTATDMEKKAMKKAMKKATSTRSLTSTTTDMEKKAMKKATSTRSLTSTATDMEKKAMKKATPRSLSRSLTSTTTDMEKKATEKATSTRSLTSTATDMEKKATEKAAPRSLSRRIVVASDAPKATEGAKRSYERDDLAGSFSKIFTASPKSGAASAFYRECMDLLDRVWPKLPEGGIYDEIFEIAAKVAHDPDFDPFTALCTLITTYDLSARQIRVCLQLISPVITVCCDLTDRLARYMGMSCANRLMGSACNESQCEKCGDFAKGVPFVRVCYNATRIGLTKGDCDSIDIDALVECIRYWLDPHEEPKAAPKAAPKSSPKSAALKRAHEKASQIAALQDGIAALQAELAKILSK